MKKTILLMLALVASVAVFAQNPPRKVYCQIVGTQKFLSNKCTVEVDYGQEKDMWAWKGQSLVDENGEKLVFNSMVDAMNFMGELGWEFQDAYVITVGQQHVYHWLLAKYISDESINEGLTTKQEYKEKQFVN